MEGGLVGDEDDEDHDYDDDDDGGGHDNDNDDDGRCGGRDGHHRMRKGRGHDDRTKHNNQIDHRRGGGDGGDGSDNNMTPWQKLLATSADEHIHMVG